MKDKKGMRSATMPKEHHEVKQPNNAVGKEKYATEFGNPEDLTRSTEQLVSFMKKNKMKY